MNETKPADTFTFDDLDSVQTAIQDESSEPNQAAIEAHLAEEPTDAQQPVITSSVSGQYDSEGTLFNAAIHAVDKDGNPSKTAKGKFRKKRGASKVAQPQKTPDPSDLEKAQKARATGHLAADLFVMSAVQLGGEEWVPIGADQSLITADGKFNEHANLRKAFGDYFEAKGVADFPPGIAFSFALMSYMMPRFIGGQETKKKVGRVREWFYKTVAKYKARKKDKQDAPQSDSRNNRERENNAGKTDGAQGEPTGARHPSS